jgi:release factor glutamine methyltransferase
MCREEGGGRREERTTNAVAGSSSARVPASPTTVGSLLVEIAGILAESNLDDPGREAREIVAALYDVPRFWPVVNGHAMVSEDVRAEARVAAAKRARGAPLAYAVRRASFRTLTLDVDERVLIPRPETELLVEVVFEILGAKGGGLAIDVGTGSGAIALSLAVEGSFNRIVATDVSDDALAVARRNAVLHAAALRTPIEFRGGSLLAPAADLRARVIVSNPPYIACSEAEMLPGSVRDWEPAVALLSGPDGLAATRRLIREAAVILEPGGLLALEVDARRASLVMEQLSADRRYRDIGIRLDLAGRERFVVARTTEKQ